MMPEHTVIVEPIETSEFYRFGKGRFWKWSCTCGAGATFSFERGELAAKGAAGRDAWRHVKRGHWPDEAANQQVSGGDSR